jgi:hypothetical protein
LGTGSYFFSNREPVSTQDVLRVPTSREAAIRRRESRSEATQRRRIADERWVVASCEGEGCEAWESQISVVFVSENLAEGAAQTSRGPKVYIPKN